MKAVLVIDLPDDMRIEDTQALYVTLYNGLSVREVMMNRPLKPLPPKLDANDWHRMFSGMFSVREAKGYGWNACLKEITGE